MDDEESKLKRQARRRLIGAVALTTFVVTLAPLVFDSEPPPQLGNDIELRIPGEAVSVESNTLSASAVGPVPAVTMASAVVPSSLDMQSSPHSAPVMVAGSAVLPVTIKNREAVNSAAAESVESKQTKPDTREPPVREEGAGEPAPAAKPLAQAPAHSAAPSAKEAVATRKGGGAQSGYVLQVGAYASADAARKMVDKLNQLGFPAYTEKAGGNVRVRIAGFATREAAEQARRKLAAQKLNANLIHLD